MMVQALRILHYAQSATEFREILPQALMQATPFVLDAHATARAGDELRLVW